jgi:hypothetical protein
MKSPFPGMDPYLEQHWRDVHTSLIIYARDQLQPALPEDLFARVEERVYVENEGTKERSMYPDVRVVEHGRGGQTAVAVEGEIELAESYFLHVRNEPVTETFIEIRDMGAGNRVITVIEFLSPSNKMPGEGQDLYLEKQQELHQGKVSLVEVDLVRAGTPPYATSAHGRKPYNAVVRRSWDPNQVQVCRLPLRERLRGILIPLRRDDRETLLGLQAIVDQCYQNGRYHTIDYQVPPEPPLSGEDASWADDLLRAAGKRT